MHIQYLLNLLYYLIKKHLIGLSEEINFLDAFMKFTEYYDLVEFNNKYIRRLLNFILSVRVKSIIVIF